MQEDGSQREGRRKGICRRGLAAGLPHGRPRSGWAAIAAPACVRMAGLCARACPLGRRPAGFPRWPRMPTYTASMHWPSAGHYARWQGPVRPCPLAPSCPPSRCFAACTVPFAAQYMQQSPPCPSSLPALLHPDLAHHPTVQRFLRRAMQCPAASTPAPVFTPSFCSTTVPALAASRPLQRPSWRTTLRRRPAVPATPRPALPPRPLPLLPTCFCPRVGRSSRGRCVPRLLRPRLPAPPAALAQAVALRRRTEAGAVPRWAGRGPSVCAWQHGMAPYQNTTGNALLYRSLVQQFSFPLPLAWSI